MEDRKKLFFVDNYGERNEVYLEVLHYETDNTLYIGLLNYEDDFVETYCDVTVHLDYEVQYNQAFISNDNQNCICKFLEENQLAYADGFVGKSGYSLYPRYNFDFEKLREYDPEGVEAYLDLMEKKPKIRKEERFI